MANPNLEHTYIRVDASGRDINGTNVRRKKKPTTGKWRLIESGSCCAPFTLISSTPADVSLASVDFVLSCDALVIATHTIATATTTIGDVVDALNGALSYYGTFTVNGTAIDLKFKQDVVDALCSAGTLTFSIVETP